MHGNVWEWCQDWYGPYDLHRAIKDWEAQVVSDPTGPASGEYRVLRGGSFSFLPKGVRAAYRANDQPADRDPNIGFRLARTIPLSP